MMYFFAALLSAAETLELATMYKFHRLCIKRVQQKSLVLAILDVDLCINIHNFLRKKLKYLDLTCWQEKSKSFENAIL